MEKILLKKSTNLKSIDIKLTASKSEANRALIIRALAGAKHPINNLAKARDTETMLRLLSNESSPTWDVLDAGTTMRFLTAYAAVKGLDKLMTGTARMQQRPIGILVDALIELGADISYVKNEGYPPHQIKTFQEKGVDHLKIRGDVSSQYISALLMVAPYLKNGLTLELTGKVGSKPYIQMTLNLMKEFGVVCNWNENIIEIPAGEYQSKEFTVEADWSAASYWYSIVALSEKDISVNLYGLKEKSNQGDSVLVQLMDQLGVKSTFFNGGVTLSKKQVQSTLEWDFTHCPDIAQTISVVCAVKGVKAKLTGLESLRIKETDRIDAIKKELSKFGVDVDVEGDEAIYIDKQNFVLNKSVSIHTYEDHRMAMAFAPIACVTGIEIEEPDVVNKSYPDYWKDLSAIGFEMEK